MTLTAHHSPPGHALRVGMVLYDDLTFDSRVQREANALAAVGHHVTIFCLEGSHETAPMLDRRVRLRCSAKGGRHWSPDKGNPLRDGQRRGSPHRATPVPRDLCAEPAYVGTRHRASIGRIRCLACPRLHRTRCRLDGAKARRLARLRHARPVPGHRRRHPPSHRRPSASPVVRAPACAPCRPVGDGQPGTGGLGPLEPPASVDRGRPQLRPANPVDRATSEPHSRCPRPRSGSAGRAVPRHRSAATAASSSCTRP